ncbi:MAG: SMI1/KNR4 family protein [Acinetobacter sp.]
MEYDLSLSKIDDSDISAFENEIGCKIPAEYRDFLLNHNGGRPRCPVLVFGAEKIMVNDLYGLGDQQGRVGDLKQTWEIFLDRLPSGFISIGDTPSGDQFLISVTDGNIYLFDHENEPEEASENLADYENVKKVADSFLDFINDLRFYE